MELAAKIRYENAKPWLLISIGSLFLGGILSLFLVLSRTPAISEIFADPLLAKRCLVVHVTLTLSCWFFGYVATLFHLLPGKKVSKWYSLIGSFGIGLLVIGGFLPSATPFLVNYFPIAHHPIFIAGIGLFSFSIAASFIGKKLLTSVPSQFLNDDIFDFGSVFGIKTAVAIYLYSLLTLLYLIMVTPLEGNLSSYYELLFWGVGHLLQFANVAALIAVWLILYKSMSGQPLLGRSTSMLVFLTLIVPVSISVIFLARGTADPSYVIGFRQLMQWGTWPGALIVIILLFRKIFGTSQPFVGNELEFTGIFASIFLLLLGFLLGTQIRGSNTLIPAHYHASIGAVSLAFMCVTYLLLKRMKLISENPFFNNWKTKQPLLFGTGQFTFSIGFAYAGLHGLGRKVYGADQLINRTEQLVGLSIMGIGGILAIAGGALFFVLLYKSSCSKPPLKLTKRIFPFGT